MATIEVDGRTIEAEAGRMLIEVTDAAGIHIPRFCYHEKLSIAANCRMCLVEVEKVPKPMPACATPVMDGMKVHTRSEIAREAQKGTMEFLLINHPLDCPVCDQGGECPLQDQALGYGKDDSRYQEAKRVVPNPDIGPLISTEMTRCIHCTRCVRFGEEVAGVMEMGAPGRGEFTRIGTFLSRSIDSEVSGNMIDLCPVGALTSRPYRFSARSWELQNHHVISPHDCVGANMRVQTLRGVVERVLPEENEDINECWLADRDRYSYEAVNSEERLLNPMIRDGREWKAVPWQTALEHAASGIRTVIESGSPQDMGALASPTVTLEEAYLLQKLTRRLGSHNVDHRLGQQDFRDDDITPLFPALELPIRKLDTVKAALLIGSNLRKEQPLLAIRLRRAVTRHGATVSALNVVDYPQSHDLTDSLTVPPTGLVTTLAAIARAVADQSGASLPEDIAALTDETALPETAHALREASADGVILLGANALQHPDAAALKAIAQWIAETTGARLGHLAPANSAAAWIGGCIPHRQANGQSVDTPGMSASDMLRQGRRAFILLGTEPELDALDGSAAVKSMKKADFVVQISAFRGEDAMQYADVLLPMAAFTESAGTFINCEGRVQHSSAATTPMGESRPAWKILRVLGNFLKLEGFDQITIEDVRSEIGSEQTRPGARLTECRVPALTLTGTRDFRRITDMPMYRGDPTLRRADALQRTSDNPPPCARLHPETLDALSLEDGQSAVLCNADERISLPVLSDVRIPRGCIHIPGGHRETGNLGLTDPVRIETGDRS